MCKVSSIVPILSAVRVLAAMLTQHVFPASQINSPLDLPITNDVDRHTHCRSGLASGATCSGANDSILLRRFVRVPTPTESVPAASRGVTCEPLCLKRSA